VFDKRALKHIPPSEEEREKVAGPTDKLPSVHWCDFSALYKLLKGESEDKKEGNRDDRSGASVTRKSRKRRHKKSSG
jgi:hypothetical protein